MEGEKEGGGEERRRSMTTRVFLRCSVCCRVKRLVRHRIITQTLDQRGEAPGRIVKRLFWRSRQNGIRRIESDSMRDAPAPFWRALVVWTRN